MPNLNPISFEGIYQQPGTGRSYAYQVTCQLAVNLQGWQSMHIRGKVWCGERLNEFSVLGHVDPEASLFGREAEVARDCVALACRRDAARASAAPLTGSLPSDTGVRQRRSLQAGG
jgi:hypothetical protein